MLRPRKATKAVCFVIWILYILVVLKLTVFRAGVCYGERRLRLVFFSDLIQVYHDAGMWQFVRLFLGNIGWFVPFGLLLPALLKRESAGKVIALAAVFSLCIEALQYVFRKGVAELDDFILNVLGAVFGYFL